ncbi:MAG: hypothetical protein GX418_04375 [Clostridiales bacterium]|nr:hypothetical protein [Clostridiales bacterium]
MFDRFFRWLRGVIDRMLDSKTAKRMGITVAISDGMQQAIHRWIDMYRGKAPWLTPNPQHLGLPALIASEMATMVMLEAEVNVTGSPRADWLAEQFRPLTDHLRLAVEYACAEGGLVFKPYVDGKDIAVDLVHADDFYPTAFNSRREITGAVFVERKRVGETRYMRLEAHQITDQGYRITNRAFKGTGEDSFTQEVPLTDVDEWADLQPEVNIQNVDHPLFGYLRIPLGNTIDPKSPVGVSVYEKASGVIEEADKQYQRLLWEYEGGELAIDAVEDAFETDQKTKQVRLPVGRERLFRPNKLDPKDASDEGLFHTFSPALRDASYIQGLNKLLQRVEDLCGISRGTLSDPNEDARTAQEIKQTRQRTYSTVTSIQRATQKAVEALLTAMDTLATLYKLCPAGKYEAAFVWDDSIVVDAETERQRDMNEVRDGLMNKWEYRVKWRGESEEQAKAALAEAEDPTDDELLDFEPKA